MNKHNISLSRLCKIIDDKKYHKVLRFRTPKFVYSRFYNKFMIEFNEMFDSNKNKEIEFNNALLMNEIFHEAYVTIPVIADNLKRGVSSQNMFEYIRDNYGIHELDVFKMIEELFNEQKRLVSRYNELKKQKPKVKTESNYTFADIIASVEDNLGGIAIDRNMSIYMFHAQYKRSIEKIKAHEQLKL